MSFLYTRFHRLASKEYLQARRRYARQSERAAGRLVVVLDYALQQILANPLLCAKYDEESLWKLLRRFPYVLFFELVNDTRIHVLAVAHSRRKPGYWKKRAKRP